VERSITITYLEMRRADQVIPYPGRRRLDVVRAAVPCPELNRFLYLAVGSDWWWHERIEWGRDRWLAWVDRNEHETWVAYRDGTPAGYFELEAQPGGEVQIAYFGLLPSFIGCGLGPELLAAAAERAWEIATERVWLHTCTLDHPRALSNYLARGFRIYAVEEKMERLPEHKPSAWPHGGGE
jgi:GNAT superfamily N-acetyltransferase